MTERPRRGFPVATSAAAQVNYSCVQIGHAILRRHRITGAVQSGNSVTHSVADATRNWRFSDIMLRTHPRPGSPQDKSKSTRRALAEIAVRIGRAEGMGRPVLWRLKPEFRER